MSWMKRGQADVGPGPQPYATPQAQPFGNQQNMYPNYQAGTGTAPLQPQPQGQPQQQQFWQMPPQQAQQQPYNQQYGQPYQQEYLPNANQHLQQPAQYNQNYANQTYANPQQNYQQNYYQNQPTQQNYSQNTGNADGWEDNWDWGWEESAKKAQSAQMQNTAQQPPVQHQVFNNANVIEDSFATTDSWNWAMDEKKESKAAANIPLKQENKEPAILPTQTVENNVNPDLVPNNVNNQKSEEVKTLGDREVVKECLPNLALGKRFHLENLTPQWSIESQMSQDSSDGPQTHSEGTYRSENQSRDSSSPGPNTDNSNFNYAQQGFDGTYTQNSEWSKNSDEVTVADSSHSNSRRESHDELSNSLQDMSIVSHENAAGSSIQAHSMGELKNMRESLPPPNVSPPSFPPPVSGSAPPAMSMPPPPPASAHLPSYGPQAVLPRPQSGSSTSSLGHSQPPPPQPTLTLSPATLPPSLPPPTNSQNPFQRAGPLSHKSTGKPPSSGPPPPFQPPIAGNNLISPTVVNKASQQSRAPVGFEANLETTPDNSERPDQPQVPFRAGPIAQSIPDNMEVAPQNDRNEYLQTAHLSSGDYGENTDFTRNLPPPGLRRMVVGQQEPEYRNLNISGDEPPPGLARMVPGQQTERTGDAPYDRPGDDYMDRHIDGQPTEGGGRPFRQADGQQHQDDYPQPQSAPARATDRRPIGLDRMVPGEPSNDEYPQYQAPNFATNEQRVVTGFDHEYPVRRDATPSNVREQNMDGSDYTEPAPRNVLGGREPAGEAPQDYSAGPDDQQREVTMEGENLQDLSVVSSADLTYSREQLDGADQNATDGGTDKNDASDSLPPAAGSRKQSSNRGASSGEDSERDRAFKASPRRERHKTSRDRDRVRDRDRDKEGRYSRGDRKYDREDRRPRDDKRTEKDRRDRERGGDASPDARKHRHSTRSRKYDTDTDYYSDRERDRRRYTSKPPRPEERDRERDRDRRYNTIERDRPRDGTRDKPRDRDRDRDRDVDRYERKYRDIDPYRVHGYLRRERDDDERRRGELSRPESRDATATDEEPAETRRERGHPRAPRTRPARAPRHHRTDTYYDGYGGGGGGAYADPYELQRQQYEYYEQLRARDPAAYMLIYKQLMAGHAPPPPHLAAARHYRAPEPYPVMGLGLGLGLGYEGRAEERGSVHSGRSSTTGLKGNDTELNTDASLNLQLEESTVRSERMTPFRYSTAHVKASIGTRDVVVVPAAYPVDGAAATVKLVSLCAARASDPAHRDLAQAPSPLVHGVTHKKSVIDYCMVRVRNASHEGARDVIGYVLVWELLALMLRQNGVVVGTDIAELLMKNTQEYEYKPSSNKSTRNESRRESSMSGSLHDDTRASASPAPPTPAPPAPHNDSSLSEAAGVESGAGAGACACACSEERAVLDKYREYLLYGNRHEALEWAMNNKLWSHALQLAAGLDRRARAAVSARFMAAIPRADPLHTLYIALHARAPPAPAYVCEEQTGTWRAHAAVLVANAGARPPADAGLERHAAMLTALGDSLASRGLAFSAQFCYVCAGVPFGRHPLAPLQPPPAPAGGVGAGAGGGCPRLTLLLAAPSPAGLAQLATTRAILATEIYEYAKSLSGPYHIPDLQVYKVVMACRLVDAGLYARALAYVEAAALAVARAPSLYSRTLVRVTAELADRLKYHDPALSGEGGCAEEGADSAEGSPGHHRWIDEVAHLARTMQAESAPQHPCSTPAHAQHAWPDQAQQYQTPIQAYVEPAETPSYPQYYQQSPVAQPDHPVPAEQPTPYTGHPMDQHAGHTTDQFTGQSIDQYTSQPTDQYTDRSTEHDGQGQTGREEQPPPQYSYEDWNRTEETHSQSYGDPYWHADTTYHYGEGATDEAPPRPTITMPGAAPASPSAYSAYDDDRQTDSAGAHQGEGRSRDTDTPNASKDTKSKEDKTDGKGRSWIGGILTKLSLRPPNQMILPDDKNPTIVWDPAAKRWRNTDGGDEEVDKPPPPPPPPKTTDLALRQHHHPPAPPPPPNLQSAPSGAPPAPGAPAPVSNIFKMQKGRHIKKSYVDVFNPGGGGGAPPAPAEAPLPAPLPAPPATYFVPAPPSGAYDPTQAGADEHHRSGI